MKNSLNIISDEKFKIDLANLLQKHKEEIWYLRREFALSNNMFKVGDIISGRGIVIKNEKLIVGTDFNTQLPLIEYKGKLYTKKLEPHKRNAIESIWQTDDIIKL